LETSPGHHSNHWKNLRGFLPWTKGCLVCGESNPDGFHARLRVEDGLVKLDYTARENDVGYRHIVHGGILMTLADEVMTWAAILEFRSVAVAAEITTRLHGPVSAGTPLRFEAGVDKSNRRLAITGARVIDTRDGSVVATASGKYMPVPREKTQSQEEDFVRSPDTIPPEIFMD
jgi:uncharacterized protein (TIGR00369 family)